MRIGGRGLLTNELIKKLQKYYGNAIRSNVSSIQDLKDAVMATFVHSCSTDANQSQNLYVVINMSKQFPKLVCCHQSVKKISVVLGDLGDPDRSSCHCIVLSLLAERRRAHPTGAEGVQKDTEGLSGFHCVFGK